MSNVKSNVISRENINTRVYAVGGRLHQAPVPELEKLRTEVCWQGSNLDLSPDHATLIPTVEGPSVDLEVTLERGSSSAAGILIRPWLYEGSRAKAPCAAAIMIDWEASELQVMPHLEVSTSKEVGMQAI